MKASWTEHFYLGLFAEKPAVLEQRSLCEDGASFGND